MARVSGLGTSLGIGQESTPGTAVTPTRWLDVNTESMGSEPVVIRGGGLRGGALSARTSHYGVIGRNASGGFAMDIATRGMGLLFKNMLGAGSSALLSGSAYKQIFTPASLTGLSFTAQKILGSTPFTHNGCKIKSWTISCSTGGNVTLTVEWDAWNEVTSFGAGTPSYSTVIEVFNFSHGAIKVGGTATTTTGLTSISGGTTVGIVQSIDVTGARPVTEGSDNRRISTAGKVEQIDNGLLDFGGTMTVDYDSAFDFYSLYAGQTATAIELTFTTTAAPISGAVYPSLSIILPDIRLQGEPPKAGGPTALSMTTPFVGLQDTAAGNPALQIVSVTGDTSIS